MLIPGSMLNSFYLNHRMSVPAKNPSASIQNSVWVDPPCYYAWISSRVQMINSFNEGHKSVLPHSTLVGFWPLLRPGFRPYTARIFNRRSCYPMCVFNLAAGPFDSTNKYVLLFEDRNGRAVEFGPGPRAILRLWQIFWVAAKTDHMSYPRFEAPGCGDFCRDWKVLVAIILIRTKLTMGTRCDGARCDGALDRRRYKFCGVCRVRDII
ncbi:hypothetical protein B0H10DRAFT_1336356 [Mycena sp. CBHHK59/15]|nr:hypothetical protein B0H10DRAFT_1336356 [Mycena sp. CBHHK59/15]